MAKFKQAAKAAVKVATPVVLAAVLTRLAGGKLDLKALALDTAEAAIAKARRPKATPAGTGS